MTRETVIKMALDGEITWLQAADICRMDPRHMRRLRLRYETLGKLPPDGRRGRKMPHRLTEKVVRDIVRLRRERYEDYSVKHFHEKLTEEHGFDVSYNWTRIMLVREGLAQPAEGRGKYHRKRERRPMRGMLVHCDGSTHEWIANLPHQDLIIMLDDADSRLLYARFFEQEGTLSTMHALDAVLRKHGRFAELYSDCGSHFATTSVKKMGLDPEQRTQVARVLNTLGIRQILTRSPQARGRCERAFGTIQGRLPQELRSAGIRSYAQANEYLERKFIADFNRRFTVKPIQPASTFVSIVGVDLSLLLSAQHERIVRNDNTVQYLNRSLQLPPGPGRTSYARCKVLVHEFTTGQLGVSFEGKLLARFSTESLPPVTLPRHRVAQPLGRRLAARLAATGHL